MVMLVVVIMVVDTVAVVVGGITLGTLSEQEFFLAIYPFSLIDFVSLALGQYFTCPG